MGSNRLVKLASWGLETKRPERCVAISAMVKVVSASTVRVVTGEVAVWLVVNIITESTLTNTILVILVKLVCDTFMSNEIQPIAIPSIWTRSGRWCLKLTELQQPRIPPWLQ